MPAFDITNLAPDRPVLIAGPTASGKSALALRIAQAQGGVVVNADALQVYQGWPILSAQPDAADQARAPHALYGHLPYDARYSTGDWLREVRALLQGDARPIIVGGTGLYFTALTEGLADIPATPPDIRAHADALPVAALIADLHPDTAARIDLNNRARIQRAWEVQRSTGRPLHRWQDETPDPILPLSDCAALVLNADKDWLNARIARRFDLMLAAGAMDEARAMLPHWDPDLLSSRTIGAREMIAHLGAQMPLDSVRDAVIIGSRQYAKRQRTWFRARMSRWHQLDAQELA